MQGGLGMIRFDQGTFVLETDNTSYCFSILSSGHLEHLYYGQKINDFNPHAIGQKQSFLLGNTISYDKVHPNMALENLRLEISSLGKGDVREPLIEMVFSDGSRTCDFLYKEHQMYAGKKNTEDLPGSYGTDEDVMTLEITMVNQNGGQKLLMFYHVFHSVDVITRSLKLINTSSEPVILRRMLSMQLDLDDADYKMTTFTGAWAREMAKNEIECHAGSYSNGSIAGVSSNKVNPFFMISRLNADENNGACMGFNLVYSGNHYFSSQVSSFNQLRVVSGIHPVGFEYTVEPDEAFYTPEAVMTYSDAGYARLSHNMHAFIRRHIVRGQWQNKDRPILLNSWEASYFKFNEQKLLKLAKKAKNAGVELFVLDDGWFGSREDDTSSLGDWVVNKKKLPSGLSGLSKKINEMGMSFGIWVEPEMVSENSDCYRAHPDWAVKIPGRAHSEGRHQMLLDLTNPEVQSFVVESMTQLFLSANVQYVKWDMNRMLSDAYSPYLPTSRQGEFSHRYVLGLYKILHTLTQKFPEILFEGCASGGNRFDLGMLCYMPQIWASDLTDAVDRLAVQNSYSYGYPLSTFTAHVSDCPNHQTLREVPLSTRFNVAAFGVLGYECNLTDFNEEQMAAIRAQIEIYKKWRSVIQYGDFYRLSNSDMSWLVVSKNRDKAICSVYQKLVKPNTPNLLFKCKGLDPEKKYRFYNIPEKHSIKVFGDLVNMVSPIHIKNGSFLQSLVSKYYKLDGEQEDYQLSGSMLNNAGIFLKQSYTGVGFDENTRLFQDFASRLYYIESVK